MNLCALFGIWCSVLTGPATVVDADTIKVQGQTVRLWGVDAPEMHERAGREARNALITIIGPDDVQCTDMGDRARGRMVGICLYQLTLTGDKGPIKVWRDLGEQVIRSGFALDCPRFSKGHYRSVEALGARERLKQKPYC